ncbi:MAG: oligosaccharide flippase family protein [Melioribacteraceae bacterium]|nr:oligosaccharide flippase family protein [Melioribacteraceae bacterium]MCF8353488.1 oligosaccharide flippase family protein [Melioribacteraceae bacterium]MCF8392617.1 oligosaccharide flippase family protein [Melioribacteraceae bacterium]MCF8418511.1 oligosaccharide flippase family protein [Melioribacteraceae bacterium]
MISKIKDIISFALSRNSSDNRSEAVWFFSAQFVNFLFGFALVKILSQLGTATYGKYALIMTIVSLLTMILYGPAIQGFNRFYYDFIRKNGSGSYLRLLYAFLINSTILLLVLIVLFSFSGSLISENLNTVFVIIAGLFILNFKLNEFGTNQLNLIRERKTNAVLILIERSLLITLLSWFLLSDSLTLNIALIIYASSAMIFGLIKILVFKNLNEVNETKITEEDTERIKKTIIVYSLPFMIWGSAGWLQLNGEKWIIEYFLSTSDVGIYAVMISLANAFIAIPSTFMGEFLTPIIFKNFSDMNDTESIKRGESYINIYIITVVLLMIIASITTYFFSMQIINLISSPDYILFDYLLPILCVGTGFFYTGQAMTTLGLALNKPKKYIIPKILAGLLAILFNIILIQLFGLPGIAYSILLVGISYIISIKITNRIILQETLPEGLI